MARITPQPQAAQPDRPAWLPWPVFPFTSRFTGIDGKQIHYIDEGSGPALLFVSAGQWSFMFRDVIVRLRGQFRCLTLDFPGCGLSPDAPGHDHSVPANAQILAGFIDVLDLQDVTMVVHDVGGPLGFLVATMRPERFRGLVISNTFGWPLAGYPAVRRTLKVIAHPLFGALNDLTNAAALFTATSYGVGRKLSKADRRAFLGPWRSVSSRRTLVATASLVSSDVITGSVKSRSGSGVSLIPHPPVAYGVANRRSHPAIRPLRHLGVTPHSGDLTADPEALQDVSRTPAGSPWLNSCQL